MHTILNLVLAATALLQAPVQPPAVPADMQTEAAVAVGRDWLLRTADNICGLRDANQLTNPGVIEFQTCLAATPEMKRIASQGIDPTSAEGIQLRNAAVTRVTNAAEAVRASDGYCSVWKEIRHKDGRAIDDLSNRVIAQY